MVIEPRTEKMIGSVKNSTAERREHEANVLAKRMVEIPSNLKMRIIYNDDNTRFIDGYAPRDLGEGEEGWLLRRFTYDSRKIVAREIAYGNWSNASGATYG